MDDAGRPTLDPAEAREHLDRALRMLEVGLQQLAEAEHVVEVARGDAEEALGLLGVAWLLADEQGDRELMGRLYWLYPQIRVEAIARAFRVKGGAGAVYRHVPNVGDVAATCRDCGKVLQQGYSSRTEAARGHIYIGLCGACQDASWARSRAEIAAQRAQRAEWRRGFEARLVESGLGDALAALTDDARLELGERFIHEYRQRH